MQFAWAHILTELDEYLQAADRENTVRSYASGIRHFEQEWKGLLPATSDAIARYLVAYAPKHAISTLRQRLAALSRWHVDQGFADPTRAVLVRKVLRGIRAKHNSAPRRARPLELVQLQRISDWLEDGQRRARERGEDPLVLRLTRDRSLLLLGFWRAFRSDELSRIRIEDVEVVVGKGLTCRLPRSKGDRELEGRTFHCPALSRLCPVDAYQQWVELASLTSGPVYPKVDRWGHVSDMPMQTASLIPLLRGLFARAGVEDASEYSSHSLRRGFAGWARVSGWDLKELMEYVGWRDVDSALRYLDVPTATLQQRFEKGLVRPSPPLQAPMAAPAPQSTDQVATIQLAINLSRPGGTGKGTARAHRLIEKVHLERFAAQRVDEAGKRFALSVPFTDRNSLDETVFALLDDIYRAAGDCGCLLEASLHEPATDTHWD